MLLVISLGLIAKLMLFCDGSHVGTSDVINVDWNQTVGTWYVLYHTPNDFEDNLECVVATYGPPEGNVSLVTLRAYDISEKSNLTLYGNSTNWTNNTYDEFFQITIIWSGRYQVITIDYNRYVILKLRSFQSNQLYIYVAFRSQQPDRATLNEVKEALRKNNINFKKLAVWKSTNCQQAVSSTGGGSSN